jgi:MFS family permease
MGIHKSDTRLIISRTYRWIGTAYLLTSTVFLPLYASLADIFGRHWAMQTSLIWFIVGSAISTGAQNMPMMLAGRGIAGVGAAGFLTVRLSCFPG